MKLTREAVRDIARALAHRCRMGRENCAVKGDCPFGRKVCELVRFVDWEEHVYFSVKKKEERHEQMG
jgi:hypothetical protein